VTAMHYRLEYPVYTIDNKLILPKGTEVTEDVLKTIIPEAPSVQKKSLLQYRTIEHDIHTYFEQDNYALIFQDTATREKLFSFMNKASLPLPVLESIYYLREYDLYTYRHMLMVFALSTLIAIDLIRDIPDLMHEIIASPTHDIGKISVPLEILTKTTPLTTTEKKVLEHHTLTGYVLLCYYFQETQNLSARIARDHHERRDGSGYPAGSNLNDLMVEIVTVTDIYDALISPRPYRPTSYDKRTALEEITNLANSGIINRDIVKTLISHHRENRPDIREMAIPGKNRGTPPKNNHYGKIIDKD